MLIVVILFCFVFVLFFGLDMSGDSPFSEKRILRDKHIKSARRCLIKFRQAKYKEEAQVLSQLVISFAKASGKRLEDLGTSPQELCSKDQFPCRPNDQDIQVQLSRIKRIVSAITQPAKDLIRGAAIYLSCKETICKGCDKQSVCWESEDIFCYWIVPTFVWSLVVFLCIDTFVPFFFTRIESFDSWDSNWGLLCHFVVALALSLLTSYVAYILRKKKE